MAINAAQKVWEWKGFDPTNDQLSTMAADAAYEQGTILIEDSSQTNRLTASSNRAEFILLKKVTTDGPTQIEKLAGADQAEVAVGEKAPVFLLRIGGEWWTTTFVSDNLTGALNISSSTAVETALSHYQGVICIKQASGYASVEFFRLKENTISTNGAIKVRCTAVS